jgi:pSer/pThr/pTyr-binding forkhead associated (FHA) protein
MESGVLTTMLIRLEHNGRIVQEIKSEEISGELTIGRSHTCTWPVPKEDTVASSRHACVFLKGRTVWLKDLESTNGTFFQGKKIEKRKLGLGDKIGIGNCTLCVEADKTEGGKAVSELMVLTGKTRGQKKPLNPPSFIIGSDPSSSLVFLDMLVSRKHAEITIKEDNSCWIRDLGSKNGTSVNGLALRDDKERLLKDGDRVAISHLEMEFHDGAVKRSNKQAMLRMGILGATFVAALALFWTYQHLRSPAEAFVRKARRLAAEEQFTPASAELEKAVNARHSASCQVAIEDLRRLLGIWETTVGLWTEAQRSLTQGKWTQASRDLGMLQAARKEAWEWNDKAPLEKENALRAKLMLDSLLHAESSIVREDVGYEELAEDNAAVKKALAVVSADTPASLVRLKSDLDSMQRRQEILLDEGSGLEKALNRLKETYPPYLEIVTAVGKARKSSEGALKRRAEVLFEPIQALWKSFTKLNEAAQLAREMEFSKAMGMELMLPPVDACSIDLRVSQARMNLDKVFLNLKSKAGQMSFLFSEIEKRIGREGESEVINAFQDPLVMEKVLSCDSLMLPLPKRSRRDAAGEYDRVLGVEEFYTHLSAMPEQADQAMLSDLPFVSLLTQAREALQKIETLKRFLNQPDNQWLAGGKVGAQMKRLDAILARRDGIVKELAERVESGSGRQALIAGGIVARLTTMPGTVTLKSQKPEEWIVAELKRLRSDLMRLNSEYTMANAARQIEIRSEIPKSGLPGDPMVRRMWSMKDAASQER